MPKLTSTGVQPVCNGWQSHAMGSAKTSEAVPSEASISSLSEASLQTSILDKPGPKAPEERRGEFRHAVRDSTSLQPVQEDQQSQKEASRDQQSRVAPVWKNAPPKGGSQPARGGTEPPRGGSQPARGVAEKEAPGIERSSGKPEDSLFFSASEEGVSGRLEIALLQPSSDRGEQFPKLVLL